MKKFRILLFFLILLAMSCTIMAEINLDILSPKTGVDVENKIVSQIDIEEGKEVSLLCDIAKENTTECNWSHYNLPISNDTYNIDESCTLNITKASYIRDNGVWMCTSKTEPSQMKTIFLTVLVQPQGPEFSFNGNKTEGIIVSNQKEVVIYCSTEISNPPSNISMEVRPLNETTTLANDVFYSFSQNITTETEDEDKLGLSRNAVGLHITNGNHYINEFVVTCNAGHSAWGNEIKTKEIKVIQQYETNEVRLDGEIEVYTDEGSTLHIVCIGNGNPSPVYHWKFSKDSNKWVNLDEKSNVLTVVVSLDTAGNYTCGASNDLNNGKIVMANKTVLVGVISSSSNESVVPSHLELNIIKPNSMEMKDGKVNLTANVTDIVIRCSVAHSNPPASLSWSVTTGGRKTCNASVDHSTTFHVQKDSEGTTSRTESELHLHFRDGFVEELKAECKVIAPKGDKDLKQNLVIISQVGSSANKVYLMGGWLTLIAILFMRKITSE